jgi:hypothetical protein
LGEEKSNSSAKRENRFSNMEDGASDEREIALTVFGIFHLQLKVCNLLDYAN